VDGLEMTRGWSMITGCFKPEEQGLAFSSETIASQVRLLVDETWTDSLGNRHVEQEIFSEAFSMIDTAEEFILLDFFLLNEFLYEPAPGMRQISQELIDKLIVKRRSDPQVEITFISDPINTIYGSIPSQQFQDLEKAGVLVVWTDLDQLRDSNPLFSKPWRLLVRPWGVGPGKTLKNPMGEGRISLRSILKLLNFKTNHRKVAVTEKSLLVTSANPHSGSSAHWNVALHVDSLATDMACKSELAILQLSGARVFQHPSSTKNKPEYGSRLELLTERKIKDCALDMLTNAEPGARIDLSMFYFSDCDLIQALITAHSRGCKIRTILDPNKDAFGRIKNGIPNRQTAAKLVKAGIPLRWADTHGEQFHVKMLYAEQPDQNAMLLLGSGNFTRKNLDNYSLECDLALDVSINDPNMERVRTVFDRWWLNPDGRNYTINYEAYEDHSLLRRVGAWWMETTGMGTF